MKVTDVETSPTVGSHASPQSVVGDSEPVHTQELVMIRMPADRIQLPNCGVVHLEIDADTLVRIGQVPPESRRGGRAALLVPPRGRTGLLTVPLGLDSPAEKPVLGRLTTLLLRERAHFRPSPDSPGTALIRQHSATYDHDKLTFELLVLSASIANLVEKDPPVNARDELSALGCKLQSSWYSDSLLDQVADLLLVDSVERIRFLLERSPRRRIGQLTTCIGKAIGDPDAIKFGKFGPKPPSGSSDVASDEAEQASVSDAPIPSKNEYSRTSGTGEAPQNRAARLRQRIQGALPSSLAEQAGREIDNMMAAQTDAADRRLRLLELCPWEPIARPGIDPTLFRKRIDEEHLGHGALKAHLCDISIRIGFAQRRGVVPVERAVLLVGPPGVGKTSLARAFAAALDRPFGQLSLGGVNDVVTLIGTAQNYANSVPGRVMNAVINSGAPDPVILLDELDRMGTSSQDPASTSVLLSLLDDSDGGCFTDAFLNIPFNVGKVIWVATANDVCKISESLLDRMEVFNVPGYNAEDRLAIAKERLVPRILAEFGLQPQEVAFAEDGISALIGRCTDSSSLRGIQAEIRRALTAAIIDIEAGRTPIVIDHEYVHLRTRRK